MNISELMMQVGYRWQQSFVLLQPRNMRDFTLVSIKTIQSCYKELSRLLLVTAPLVFWFVWLDWYQQIPTWCGTYCFAYDKIAVCFWLALVVLATRPTVGRKDMSYFLSYSPILALSFFFSGFALVKMRALMILWLFFTLFYLDSVGDTAADGLVSEAGKLIAHAGGNALKMCLFIAPLLLLFGIPLTLLYYVLPWSVNVIFLVPIAICIFTNLYIRERYTHFSDYQ